MKKTIIVLVLTVFILLNLSACAGRTYPFSEPVDQIMSVELVSAESSLDYTVRKTLSETEKREFLEQFQKILFRRYIDDPVDVHDDAVKITYQSGNYEMICYFTNEYVKDGEIWFCWERCGEEDFNALFNSFLT